MRPLYYCRACGFLSTLGSEFKRRDGVLFDKDCLDRADSGEEPVATWVREAIAARQASTPSPETDPPHPSVLKAGE